MSKTNINDLEVAVITSVDTPTGITIGSKTTISNDLLMTSVATSGAYFKPLSLDANNKVIKRDEVKTVVVNFNAPLLANSNIVINLQEGMTITGWTIFADATSTATLTVSKCSYVDYPSFTSIVAAQNPTISATNKATYSSISNWTTSIAAGDIIKVNLDSYSGSASYLQFTLKGIKA